MTGRVGGVGSWRVSGLTAPDGLGKVQQAQGAEARSPPSRYSVPEFACRLCSS